jgi:ribosome-binding factor A
MNQRVQRLAMEIREILGEILTREEIKDHRVQNVGIITLTHVRLTGDLQKATALFTVHGLDTPALRNVRDGLNHAGGYLRRRLGKELSVRTVPTVHFEIDTVFEQSEKVEKILREISPPAAPAPADDSDAAGSDAADPEGARSGSSDADDAPERAAGEDLPKA